MESRAPTTDKFAKVRGFIEAWNENMSVQYRPSYLVCLDESMVAWTNKHTCPGWTFLPRKPHPMGNEYHTIACAATHIIFHVELVEGKDRPASRGMLQHEAEYGKMGGLILRMCESIMSSGRIVVMDSAFCNLRAAVALAEQLTFCIMVIKKRRYWPKGVDGDGIEEHMEAKAYGAANCRDGTLNGHRCTKGQQTHPEACHNIWIYDTTGQT